ncbi:META domain-containing protein [Rhodophyticola sp. CCM32]|uniref:META domain-containing protein n=1 Tax=Rhodophyticola sp. CCM32 TaxID=2916397 RepID=UPI00107F3C2B|nr:META domain-containing protein [Rhodophyticola sp. CCM32]QBY02299.1 META domain-containing protein [Rhodophyticola sp. CCM32]
MPRLTACCLASLLLTACQGDETISGYANGVWTLTEMDGGPAPAQVILDVTEQGRISGHSPCNRYSGSQNVPYPWFETGPLSVTRMACPELEAETRYLALLHSMTLAEATGDVLILSNEAGEELIFARQLAD